MNFNLATSHVGALFYNALEAQPLWKHNDWALFYNALEAQPLWKHNDWAL